jgi:hypothetical protein
MLSTGELFTYLPTGSMVAIKAIIEDNPTSIRALTNLKFKKDICINDSDAEMLIKLHSTTLVTADNTKHKDVIISDIFTPNNFVKV